ncbi:sulfite exporter TauE/SafE [mine drainage metagenome]|uniref:Sulfite exporter TauE/SafE n=1 Tax=mine drainage metagenome TaxID=410659 RepID=A0A1J5RR68_9ZZZZ
MMMLAMLSGMLTGVALGIFGSGGGIIVVPALIYLLHLPPKEAIAMGLGIIAITAVLSVVSHWRASNVDWRAAAIFGPIGMIGTYAGARVGAVVPASFQLGLFAVVMYIAAYRMLRKSAIVVGDGDRETHIFLLIAAGAGVGLLAGVVGVGGGFLIVPALVLLASVPMKRAVGTSLAVVSLNSASGFVGYMGTVPIHYALMGSFAAVTVISSFTGAHFARRLHADTLKRAFAWSLVIAATYIMVKSVI